jgi:uncharacterized protein with PQ loop repeat
MTVLAPYADLLGTAATVSGVVGAGSSLLQARKLARTQSAESVSVGFLAKYLGGYLAWALYGVAIGSTPLIAVDLIGICTSSVTVGIALRVSHAPRVDRSPTANSVSRWRKPLRRSVAAGDHRGSVAELTNTRAADDNSARLRRSHPRASHNSGRRDPRSHGKQA